MTVSSRYLRRPWLASFSSGETFRRLTQGTTRNTRNSDVISPTEAGDAEPMTVGSVPLLYKNQPSRHTAMSKFASAPSSTRGATNFISSLSGFANQQDELSFPSHFGKSREPAHVRKPSFGQSYSTVEGANYNSDLSEDFTKVKGFDICLPGNEALSTGYSMKVEDMYPRVTYRELRPGMVLAKNFLRYRNQVEIVRTCRMLGVGPRGFYQPVYKDGAELDGWMMSLGLNWNPEKLTYEFIRSVDGCEVPAIPPEFLSIAHRAILFVGDFIETEFNTATYEGIIPQCFLNACVVSFCSAVTRRVGLHQDCSERRENLSKGLPVVSISVGDSAEFLYGDESDVDKAEKVLLESGDMLIFGGKSRHIYHGVSSIIPNSASEFLVEDTKLRPGRLNLTFIEA